MSLKRKDGFRPEPLVDKKEGKKMKTVLGKERHWNAGATRWYGITGSGWAKDKVGETAPGGPGLVALQRGGVCYA